MKKYRIIKKYRIYLYCGSAMLISEIWKQWCLTWMIGDGRYNWWHFPFQLCSIPMYVCLLIPFVKSEKVRGNLFHFLMDFGLLAGILEEKKKKQTPPLRAVHSYICPAVFLQQYLTWFYIKTDQLICFISVHTTL